MPMRSGRASWPLNRLHFDPKVYLIGQLPVQISASDVVLVAVATLGICFLSTLYPALRASRLRAVDGLRYN